ncbi:glycosyltransferase family 9 protein [Geofilum rubicundum]|uniref:ADP-heptose:LPS heptosyltransferase n=1 Tax=Geofilum rubicundum JCM 15548 TaxID=1236989 RepID=A0A0E9LSJ5_9BACT|nr:glycosyltransferase family 9 protein [Geofilum rubicundum]GAO28263.1 ADP-heptose:LPS heptosyltransferase [Geofilum rubicundum JCM 15548]
MSRVKRILVFRFSALGDVAMTIPVLWSFTKQYPDYEMVFVSRPFVGKLFEPLSNVRFIGVDFNGRYKGFGGLVRLFLDLRKEGPFDFMVDLHGVLRTQVLKTLFRLAGVSSFSIDKGRAPKKALTRKTHKIFRPLATSFDNYRQVFLEAGLDFHLGPFPGRQLYGLAKETKTFECMKGESVKVGFAPFAKHPWKMWPEEKARVLVEEMEKRGFRIFLFGGRGAEQEQLAKWALGRSQIHNLAGQYGMDDELRLMGQLDVMVSMDSANMHLASLVETPVVSIWGATHPYAGFYGWGQDPDSAVQTELACRPCSVFGNKPCHRGDFACMQRISPEMVIQKISRIIQA